MNGLEKISGVSDDNSDIASERKESKGVYSPLTTPEGDRITVPKGHESRKFAPKKKKETKEDILSGEDAYNSDLIVKPGDRLNGDSNSSLLGKLGIVAIIGVVGGGLAAGAEVYGFNKGYDKLPTPVSSEKNTAKVKEKIGDLEVTLYNLDGILGESLFMEFNKNGKKFTASMNHYLTKLVEDSDRGDCSQFKSNVQYNQLISLLMKGKEVKLIGTGEIKKFNEGFTKTCTNYSVSEG